MKKLALLGLSLLVTACSKNTVDRDDLVEREGVLYEKFATQPFSGLVEGNVSGVVEDGKWEGTGYEFNEDGNVILESNYVNGLRERSERIYSRYGRGYSPMPRINMTFFFSYYIVEVLWADTDS